MNEQERADQLEQALTSITAEAGLDDEQRALLALADDLRDPGLQPSRIFHERLHQELSARADHAYSSQRRKQQVKHSFAFVLKSAAWVGAAALLVLALTWAIQNQPGTLPPVEPAAPAQPVISETTHGPEQASGFRLEAGEVVEIDDGFVIPLRIVPVDDVNAWVALPLEPRPTRMFGGDVQAPFVITAADGERLAYEIYEYPASGAEGYSYKLPGKAFEWPVTVELSSAYVSYPDERVEFTLDTGTEYHPGQEWEIDQSLELAERSVRLLSVQSGDGGYYVQLSRSGVQSVEVTVAEDAPRELGARSAEGDGPWVYPLLFQGEPPGGMVTFVFYSPVVKVDGPWKIEVQP